MTDGATPEQQGLGSESHPAARRERILANGFRLVEQEVDYDRGKVDVIQVIPPDITKEHELATRKQIYIPGYRPSWVDKPAELQEDLIALAELNREAGREVIMTGIAFTGDRKHRGHMVPDIDADVTRTQYEKAQDYVEGLADIIEGDNAEIAAHSYGGTVGVVAASLGLSVDTIGLFNSAGLYKESSDQLHILKLPKSIQAFSQATFDTVREFLEKRKEKRGGKTTGRAILNRILESRVENYAAYRSLIHKLLPGLRGKRIFIANSSDDKLYPKLKVRGVLEAIGVTPAPNIELVDLSWARHSLGRHQTRRKRLREIVSVMQRGQAVPVP